MRHAPPDQQPAPQPDRQPEGRPHQRPARQPARHPDRRDDRARRRDAAFVLPLFGVILLLPPFINLFLVDWMPWGIPLEVIYLFAVWIGLVLGAWLLSRGLDPQSPGRDGDDIAPSPPPASPQPPSLSPPGLSPPGPAAVQERC